MTVLLTPSYEEPVETAEDLIKRNIIPFLTRVGEIYKQMFAASSDPNYQEISQRLVIAKDAFEWNDMARKAIATGMYAEMTTFPTILKNEGHKLQDWYRSTEKIGGTFPYSVHLSNKKWPLKKVIQISIVIVKIIS